MKNLDIVLIIIALFVVFGIGLAASFDSGYKQCLSDIKQHAIKNDAASYEINPKTGEIKFVWHTEPHWIPN